MKTAARILVVHVDARIRGGVADALRREGHETAEASTAAAAESAIEDFRPNLVVMDIVLPDGNGLEIARRLKLGSDPIALVFLTGRTAIEDLVAGLAVGDDFVTKPFHVREIVARVQAVLRRMRLDPERVLWFADIVLNEDRHEVRRGGELVDLTPTEFNLLRFFLANPRRVLTKDQIVENVWGDSTVEPAVVETYVSYLRKKLDRVGPPLIQTFRQFGYALREPDA